MLGLYGEIEKLKKRKEGEERSEEELQVMRLDLSSL